MVADRSGTLLHHTGLWFLVLGVPFVALTVWLLARLSEVLGEVPGTRRRLAVGFAVLLSGAVGAEVASNLIVSEDTLESGTQTNDAAYVLLVAAEESLEMLGGSILLWASLMFARLHWSTRSLATLMVPAASDEMPNPLVVSRRT